MKKTVTSELVKARWLLSRQHVPRAEAVEHVEVDLLVGRAHHLVAQRVHLRARLGSIETILVSRPWSRIARRANLVEKPDPTSM